MIAICQQPNYFPTLGYFEQCARAEKIVFLDSVQWIKQGQQHRTKILPHLEQSGESHGNDFQWLTLPVQSKEHRSKTIGEIQLSKQNYWNERHWKTLQAIYGSRPFFKKQFEPIFRPWFEKAVEYQTLSEASIGSVLVCMDALELRSEILLSSRLSESGTKTERLISLCKSVNADIYYSGLASASYLNGQAFREANIQLLWQRWKTPNYEQGRKEFKSHLSILDAFANVPLSEIKGWLEIKPWGPFGSLQNATEL